MADGGNKRNFRIIDGSDDNFFVKRPEVFKTAAAAGDNQDVRPGNGAAARQGIEAFDGCGDFFGGSFALYGGRPDNNAAGKAVANAVNNVTNDGAAGRGDNADDVRQKGNGFFVRRVEQAFGGKFLFSFFQKFEQRAGTGKTYLAVALAVSMMLEGKIDKIILSRPAVEAGENLGFLPGDLKDKVDPYLRPLYDALYEMLPAEQVDKKLAIGEIEIAPLAFMRGRTLSNAFVILDEAQNTTPMQMKMFLTRLGENSRMVVNGDLSQVDLPRGVISGLKDALDTLENVSSISSVTFSANDVVRHGLVAKIVKAYEEKGKKQHGYD